MTILAYLLALFATPILGGVISIPVMLATLPLLIKKPRLKFPVAALEGAGINICTFGLFIWFVRSVLDVAPSVWMLSLATLAFVSNDVHRLSTRPDKDLEAGHFVGDVAGIWIAWFIWR
jgi:hypothetical protein